MKDILKKLNQEVGVKGSVVVTHDGIVVASELGEGLEKDVVAAMAASVISAIYKALSRVNNAGFARFILTASYGKMVFVDTGTAFLVVVADKSINIDTTLLEIQSAALRIKTASEIKV